MNTVISQPVPKWNSSINVVFRIQDTTIYESCNENFD